MPKVTCPCCHGKGQLIVTSHIKTILPGIPADGYVVDAVACCHCEGTGKVDAEVEDPTKWEPD